LIFSFPVLNDLDLKINNGLLFNEISKRSQDIVERGGGHKVITGTQEFVSFQNFNEIKTNTVCNYAM
jgi:hypothetical protein